MNTNHKPKPGNAGLWFYACKFILGAGLGVFDESTSSTGAFAPEATRVVVPDELGVFGGGGGGLRFCRKYQTKGIVRRTK